MSNRFFVPALLLAVTGVGGWAVAQQSSQEPLRTSKPSPGRYTVVAAGQSAILLDTGTGRTWVMNQGVNGDSAWLPSQKFDNEETARQWLATERQRAEATTALQRELANRLEEMQRDMARRLDGQRSVPRLTSAPNSPKDNK